MYTFDSETTDVESQTGVDQESWKHRNSTQSKKKKHWRNMF
jgi:hypothetical protein